MTSVPYLATFLPVGIISISLVGIAADGEQPRFKLILPASFDGLIEPSQLEISENEATVELSKIEFYFEQLRAVSLKVVFSLALPAS